MTVKSSKIFDKVVQKTVKNSKTLEIFGVLQNVTSSNKHFPYNTENQWKQHNWRRSQTIHPSREPSPSIYTTSHRYLNLKDSAPFLTLSPFSINFNQGMRNWSDGIQEIRFYIKLREGEKGWNNKSTQRGTGRTYTPPSGGQNIERICECLVWCAGSLWLLTVWEDQ